jgi:ATP-dependent phosphoenolpyruvate carboxykinase
MVAAAEKSKKAAERVAPEGAQVVVVVTDFCGNWVGVSSNVDPHRTEALLQAALDGADRQDPEIIETTGAA